MDQRLHGGAVEVGGFSRVLLHAPLGPCPPFAVSSIFCVLHATGLSPLSLQPSGFPVKLRLYPGVPGVMKSPLDTLLHPLFTWNSRVNALPLSPDDRLKASAAG